MDDLAASDPGPLGAAPPTVPPDPLRAYRSWASALFTILLAVALLVTVLALGGMAAFGVAALAIALVGVALVIVVLVAEISGLRRVAPWAVHAIRPLCLILIIAGLVRFAAGLLDSRVDIPLEALGALLVLTRPHPGSAMPALDDAGRRARSLVVGGFVVAQALPLLVLPFAQGTVLGAAPGSLALDIRVACGTSPSLDAPMTATVEWAWTAGEPFPPPADGVLVEWYLTTAGDGDAGAGAVLVADRPSDPQRITAGGEGEASGALARVTTGGGQTWEYLIDLRPSGTFDGSIELDLAPRDPSALSGSLEVRAWYAHGDRWVVDAGTAGCGW